MSEALLSRRFAGISAAMPLALIGATVMFAAASTKATESAVTLILCNLVIVCGLQVFIGNSGIYSFGQLSFAALGAYAAALLSLPAAIIALQTPGLPDFISGAHPGPFEAALIGALAGALVASVVGLLIVRTATLAIPISTFAFLIVVYNLLANSETLTGGSGGLVAIPNTTDPDSAGLWAGAAVLVALGFKFSASGYRLRATREDEVAARALGIAVTKERLLAFALSGALCGLGGALSVQASSVLSPTTFYFGATVTTLTMLIVGGSGSVLGAVLGTFCVAGLNEALRGLEEGGSLLALSFGQAPGLAAIGLGLALLATMILRPQGLSGGREAGELGRLKRSRVRLDDKPTAVPANTPSGSAAKGELRASGVSVAFAGLQVLSDVELQLSRNEALGLIGPNGAGKTTLVNVLSGFQAPDTGELWLDGTPVNGYSPTRLARAGLSRTFQAVLPFAGLSVLESVAVGAMGTGTKRREAFAIGSEVLKRLGLGAEAEKMAADLPAGTQRLLGIARALAGAPRYLLLDEPAAGLSERERVELVAALRGIIEDFGCGLLLIEHDIGLVMELCSRVQVLDSGVTVALGPPAEVQGNPLVREAYLGASFAGVADA